MKLYASFRCLGKALSICLPFLRLRLSSFRGLAREIQRKSTLPKKRHPDGCLFGEEHLCRLAEAGMNTCFSNVNDRLELKAFPRQSMIYRFFIIFSGLLRLLCRLIVTLNCMLFTAVRADNYLIFIHRRDFEFCAAFAVNNFVFC